MTNISKLGYKKNGELTKELLDDGYIVEIEPITFHSIINKNGYCYEDNVINQIKNNTNGIFDFSKNMIDVGSHIGIYDLLLDFNYYYMFESNKEYYIISQFNMLLQHKLDKCDIFNTLISDSIENTKYQNNKILPITILDSYNLDNIGLIKISVNGDEYKVIKGAIETIKRNNYPPILFKLLPIGENMSQEKYNQLLFFLIDELNYEIYLNWGNWQTHLAIHKNN